MKNKNNNHPNIDFENDLSRSFTIYGAPSPPVEYPINPLPFNPNINIPNNSDKTEMLKNLIKKPISSDLEKVANEILLIPEENEKISIIKAFKLIQKLMKEKQIVEADIKAFDQLFGE